MMRKYAFYIVLVCFVAFYIQKPLFGLIPNTVAGIIQDKKEEERIAEFLKDYSKVDVQHVTIHYMDFDEELLPTTKVALERGIELNNEMLGQFNDSVDLIIFPNKADRINLFGIGHFINNNDNPYYNTVNIFPADREEIFPDMAPADLLYKNVIHDYTQFVINQRLDELSLSVSYIPSWFIVGVGEYISNVGKETPPLETEAVRLSSLNSKIAGLGDDDENAKYNGYVQSHLTIKYLVDEFGPGIINEILIETEEEKSFNKAFPTITGIDLFSVPNIY
ncbi:hypothetical protein [Psychrobacillus sp. BL-248-WT-3]|uniref:hypothetical protein n=1 Tax=Psychrobacillus sp. BL-248-WT-3 TaxID=2725306 RepID=UPI00146C6EEE|nr:hypothetical protein [Psychrobacillus sp. BL-248-WT-3]NME06205.1 hypothetical protein [Psychrobacillus sp. BL-248-WT-3]